jgi:hypothetical protein
MSTVPVIVHPSEVMSDNKAVLSDLLAVLAELGAKHALMGGLAAGYHGRVRATIDVDLLVPKRFLKRLAKALEGRGYVVRALPDMLRVYPSGATPEDEAVADLVGLESNPVLRAAFAATEPAVILGLPVQVVRRGAFVALKFHAALASTRRLGDRYQDVSDVDRVLAKGFGPDDEKLAHEIAERMYAGARADLAVFIDDLRHGRPVKI